MAAGVMRAGVELMLPRPASACLERQPDPADLCQHRAGALPAQAGPAHTPGLHAWHRADLATNR